AYVELAKPAAQPLTEYFWFLLYWSLAFLDPIRYRHDTITKDAILESAGCVYSWLNLSVEAGFFHRFPTHIVNAVDTAKQRHQNIDLSARNLSKKIVGNSNESATVRRSFSKVVVGIIMVGFIGMAVFATWNYRPGYVPPTHRL